MEETQVAHARKDLYDAVNKHQQAQNSLRNAQREYERAADDIKRCEDECKRWADIVDQNIRSLQHRQKVADK